VGVVGWLPLAAMGVVEPLTLGETLALNDLPERPGTAGIGTGEKLKASLAESYCFVGVGVDLGELDELLTKKG
jgi:hypothetical protein